MDDLEQLTAWAGDPERVDPDDYAPNSPFAKEMTWAPCEACGIQVHAPVTQVVYRGLACPRCGAGLLDAPEHPEEWTGRVLREEDEFSEQL